MIRCYHWNAAIAMYKLKFKMHKLNIGDGPIDWFSFLECLKNCYFTRIISRLFEISKSTVSSCLVN